jgi:hypothetical protein
MAPKSLFVTSLFVAKSHSLCWKSGFLVVAVELAKAATKAG